MYKCTIGMPGRIFVYQISISYYHHIPIYELSIFISTIPKSDDLYVFYRLPDVHDGVHQRTQPAATNRRGQTMPRPGQTPTTGAQVQRETMRGAVSIYMLHNNTVIGPYWEALLMKL